MSVDIEELRNFLTTPSETDYASGDEKKWTHEEDGSTTISYEDESGKWRMDDNFFGGEPYGGRSVVFNEGKAVWMMTYYGWVNETIEKPGEQVYPFLQAALKRIPQEAPFRGPKEYVDGNLVYKNDYQGTIERFSGVEVIEKDGGEIYRANYSGGLVDQR